MEKKISRRSEEKQDKLKNPRLEATEKATWESIQNCCHVCKEREDCFQYVCYDKTYMLGLSCRLGKHVSVSGDGKIVYTSDWIVDRIRMWTEKNVCMGQNDLILDELGSMYLRYLHRVYVKGGLYHVLLSEWPSMHQMC